MDRSLHRHWQDSTRITNGGGVVRNRWTVEGAPVIGWTAQVDETHLVDVLRSAEHHAVHCVTDAPGIGYGPDPGAGRFSDFVARDAGPDRVAAFRAIRRATSRIARVDPTGRIVEGDVADLGAVLAAGPHAGPSESEPALRVRPFRTGDRVQLRVASCSDIWLPWCSVRYEPDAHVDDLGDNRALCEQHTPRLNAFLTRVAELADPDDGGLRIDPDNTAPDLAFQLHDGGVRLEVDDPRERTVWRRFGGPDGPDLTDALLEAALEAEAHPPPVPYRAAIGGWSADVDHVVFRVDREVLRTLLRDSGLGELLGGRFRVKVQAGVVRHAFEPEEISR